MDSERRPRQLWCYIWHSAGSSEVQNLVDNYQENPDDVNKINEADMTVTALPIQNSEAVSVLTGLGRVFDFTIFFNYMYGFDVNNVNKYRMSSWLNNSYNNLFRHLMRLTGSGYVNDLDSTWCLTHCTRESSDRSWDRHIYIHDDHTCYHHFYVIEDGSFLRLQMWCRLHRLKNLQKAAISRCRLYFTGYNLFYTDEILRIRSWSKYQNGLTPGVDDNVYPRSRITHLVSTYILSVTIKRQRKWKELYYTLGCVVFGFFLQIP